MSHTSTHTPEPNRTETTMNAHVNDSDNFPDEERYERPRTEADPTPPHGTERPPIPETDALTEARARAEAEWTWPETRRPHHTWTDVARLVARLDSQAVAAGHPATYGTLHLVTPEAPGDHARIERRGSADRIPGGGILATDATNSHAMLTARLELYRDLADAGHDSARVYLLERGDR